LENDILRIKNSGICDYLILDYTFAYCNEQIKKYIDISFYRYTSGYSVSKKNFKRYG